MSLYVLGDLHLSLASDKPMEVFGERWDGHLRRLEEGLSLLRQEDTIVLCGDLSWAMDLPGLAADLLFLAKFPGHKVILKGNHDYWWTTVSKMKAFLNDHGLCDFTFLHNNALLCGDIALCGTRGWFYEQQGDEKVFRREVGRLQISLEAGRKLDVRECVCFLHYPPLYEGYRCDEMVDLMRQYGVKRCYYGHLHGYACQKAIEGDYMGIEYHLVSADHLRFTPVKL